MSRLSLDVCAALVCAPRDVKMFPSFQSWLRMARPCRTSPVQIKMRLGRSELVPGFLVKYNLPCERWFRRHQLVLHLPSRALIAICLNLLMIDSATSCNSRIRRHSPSGGQHILLHVWGVVCQLPCHGDSELERTVPLQMHGSEKIRWWMTWDRTQILT